MRNTTALSTLLVLFLAAAAPVSSADPGLPGGDAGPDDEGFFPCPVPACMAPCQFPPVVQGLCKAPDGTVGETSFFCCCCGGSDASFKFSSPMLDLHETDGTAVLTWTELPGSGAYDVVRGDLDTLRGGAGDYGPATLECVADDHAGTTHGVAGTPEPGKAFWFVVRGSGSGGWTYDATHSASQSGWRDAEIAASDNDCSTAF